MRVDLYDLPDGPRFGQLTFWPEAGLCRFEPASYDQVLGGMWSYPQSAPAGRRAPLAAVSAR